MSEELKESYALLRAKDEVMAESASAIPAALCVAVIGVVALFEGAWLCAAISLSCASLLSVWHLIFSKIVDWCIRRRGFSEVELERLDLA